MQFRTSKLTRALRGRDRPRRRLVDCEHCGREFVIPVSWFDLDEERWSVRLRCGECGSAREVVIDNEEAHRFEADLDRGAREMARSLSRMIADGCRRGDCFVNGSEERHDQDPHRRRWL